MNGTNVVFDAYGIIDSLQLVGNGWFDALTDFGSEFLNTIVQGAGYLILIVGIWYGIRAVLRAMRAPK